MTTNGQNVRKDQNVGIHTGAGTVCPLPLLLLLLLLLLLNWALCERAQHLAGDNYYYYYYFYFYFYFYFYYYYC